MAWCGDADAELAVGARKASSAASVVGEKARPPARELAFVVA